MLVVYCDQFKYGPRDAEPYVWGIMSHYRITTKCIHVVNLFCRSEFCYFAKTCGAHFEKVLRKDEKMSHQSFWQRDKNGLEIFEALNFNFEMFREDKTGERV